MMDSKDNSGKFKPREVVQGKTQIHLSRDVVLDQFKPGKLINARFEIRELIGEGGMGMVFRATDTHLSQDVALKIPLPELIEDPKVAERFKSEVRHAMSLTNEHIVRVHDLHVEQSRKLLFFSMELLQGRTLREELTEKNVLRPDKVRSLLLQLLEGLNHAHQKGILHRDLKPENIFLCEDGTVKLMDFGIASPIWKTSRFSQLHPSGTFAYMAPELQQDKEPTPNSDIYSVGVVLYEMLTGDLPGFASEPPSKLDKSIPPFWDDVVAGCMKNRKRRYQNVGELQEAIKKGTGRDSTQSHKTTMEEQERTFSPQITNHKAPITAPQAPHESPVTDRAHRSSTLGWIVGIIIIGIVGTMIGVSVYQFNQRKQVLRHEEQLWNAAKLTDTIDAYNMYLNSTDLGNYSDSARTRINSLEQERREEQQRIARQQQEKTKRKKAEQAQQEKERKVRQAKGKDDAAYRIARSTNTPSSYQAYLSDYGKGSHASEAQSAIKRLKRQEYEGRSRAAREKDDAAWNIAKRINTKSSYRVYLSDYANGRHASDARNFIRKLQQPTAAESSSPAQSLSTSITASPKKSSRSSHSTSKTQHPAPGRETAVTLPGGVQLQLAHIPSGSFMMGSPSSEQNCDSDEKPQHRVAISRGFWMGKYEVTQAQWKSVMGYNPSRFKGDNLPVEEVSWNDVQDFINKLNARTGKRFRLPTEAEWEYVCRAGTDTAYSFGEQLSCSEANYGNGWSSECKGSNPGKTTSVGSYRPNGFGLFDMHGNVWEWCSDWYGKYYYKNSPSTDPTGPANGVYRVRRGGSWGNDARSCRSANRVGYYPSHRNLYLGFRLARDE